MTILNCFFRLKYSEIVIKILSIGTIALVNILFISCEKYPCPPVTTIKSSDSITITLQGSGASRTTMLEGYGPERTTNYSSSELMLAGEYGSAGMEERSLLDFDYSSIPSNAVIKKATLTLYANTTSPAYLFYSNQGHYADPTATNEWALFRVLSSWDQSTVTWDTSPSIDNINQISFPASTAFDQTYTADVTTLVTDQLQNPSLYFGFMMISLNDNLFAPAYVSFFSGTYSNIELRPKMEITYQIP